MAESPPPRRRFSLQVAGHKFEDGKQGMLVEGNYVLKPVQSGPRHKRERDFYAHVISEHRLPPGHPHTPRKHRPRSSSIAHDTELPPPTMIPSRRASHTPRIPSRDFAGVARELARFVPRYYGVLRMPAPRFSAGRLYMGYTGSGGLSSGGEEDEEEEGEDEGGRGSAEVSMLEYLKLEHLVVGFAKPCILDIKIGRVTYEPDAPHTKQAREVEKFPLQAEMGFRVAGVRAYRPGEGVVHFDKHYGRTLTPHSVTPFLRSFFMTAQGAIHRSLILALLTHLRELLLWFESQSAIHFIASSILVFFDGHHLDVGEEDLNGAFEEVAAGVKLIDFAHVRYDVSTPDDNFIYGLRRLVTILEAIRSGDTAD